MNLLEGNEERFLHGYIMTRTEGSSSRHKYPTMSELEVIGQRYSCPDKAIKAALARLVERGQVKFDGCYYCTPEHETDVL